MCYRVTMPDNVELRKKRLVKKKEGDNVMDADSDEEMLQQLDRAEDGSEDSGEIETFLRVLNCFPI